MVKWHVYYCIYDNEYSGVKRMMSAYRDAVLYAV